MTSFATETEARQFFIARIIHQAEKEGVSLSDDERRMLSCSESAPDSVADSALVERLSASISDADYEAKIVGLLKNSFNEDTALDPIAKPVWDAALAVLQRGDHYVLVMINEALGKATKPWWQFWTR